MKMKFGLTSGAASLALIMAPMANADQETIILLSMTGESSDFAATNHQINGSDR